MSHTEFNEEQFLSIYPDGIEKHYWTLARNLIIQKELKKNGISEKKLLEIGAGRGVVVESLRNAGFDCAGVDLANITVPDGMRKFLFTGKDFDELSFDLKNSVEVVMLFDVIEHLEDPFIFLHRIQESFPHATHCMISVPARQELWSNYDIFNGHHVRYSLETLSFLFSQLRWKTLHMQYAFHLLYLPGRLLLRSTGKRRTVIKAPKGFMVPIHRFLAFLLVLDYNFFPKKYFGSSIVAVARLR